MKPGVRVRKEDEVQLLQMEPEPKLIVIVFSHEDELQQQLLRQLPHVLHLLQQFLLPQHLFVLARQLFEQTQSKSITISSLHEEDERQPQSEEREEQQQEFGEREEQRQESEEHEQSFLSSLKQMSSDDEEHDSLSHELGLEEQLSSPSNITMMLLGDVEHESPPQESEQSSSSSIVSKMMRLLSQSAFQSTLHSSLQSSSQSSLLLQLQDGLELQQELELAG